MARMLHFVWTCGLRVRFLRRARSGLVGVYARNADHDGGRTGRRMALNTIQTGLLGARVVGWLAALVVAMAAGGSSAQGVDTAERDAANRRCLRCHGQEKIGTLGPGERRSMVGTLLDPNDPSQAFPEKPGDTTLLKGDEPATRPGLFVAHDALAGSVHRENKCVDCHEDAAKLPHEPKLNTKTCATSCHTKAAEAFPSGAHYEALKRGRFPGADVRVVPRRAPDRGGERHQEPAAPAEQHLFVRRVPREAPEGHAERLRASQAHRGVPAQRAREGDRAVGAGGGADVRGLSQRPRGASGQRPIGRPSTTRTCTRRAGAATWAS
jgi:hypothetical protein